LTDGTIMAFIRVNHRPAPRQLLVFAAGWAVVVGTVGVFQWMEEREAMARGCWLAAAAVPLLGAVWRDGLRRFYIALTYAVFPVGWLVSTVVLAALYYGLITPIGWLLRWRGHDPMQRGARSRADSYWHPRPPAPPPARYFRQY
jgi:hypothetical protein